jgi:hypothetical protein
MRALLSILFVGFISFASAQVAERIYLFPGQGSDGRIFQELVFDAAYYEVVVIAYPRPARHERMHDYALRLSHQIDTTLPYSFIGVSLGGMLACELNTLFHPKQTVILSSAKDRRELPPFYRSQRIVPVYRLIPAWLIKTSSHVLQPLFEPDRKTHKAVFKSMLRDKDARFIKRAIGMIAHWSPPQGVRVIHIHGNNDHTLPIRRIHATHVVDKGSHMMTLTGADHINALLALYFRQ